MRKYYLLSFVLCMMSLVFTSCQKVAIDDLVDPEPVEGGVVVRFNVTQLEQIPFENPAAARATDVKMLCTRISLAVYQGGVKINQVNQMSSDTNFGQLSLSLLPGTYRIVLLAHSGLKNPTMTDINKISFDGKVTDTFYCCEDIRVDGSASHDMTLKRAVAMFRLKVLDKIPTSVANMRFYYTGGSSTFDAVAGAGCVNSRQTEMRPVTSDMLGASGTFEVYTFPRFDSNALNMTVTAMDAGNNTIAEKSFPQVNIQRNMITQYQGNFFGGSMGGENLETGVISIGLVTNDEWTLSNQVY